MNQSYRVLARKYRPTVLKDVIGQETLVRILTNAFASGRIAHAFMLTGVRGVGKTTTARIIARSLNCIGPNGSGEMTVEPCGVCTHCSMIDQDRHVDVLEIDAASRTGVSDMREIIDSVKYMPVSARYKVYIIDEVHMLSTSAFNALLKTLEEPPPHVKFIFATTEIRKVPITVLSRCQRFDLRRVDVELLSQHLIDIAKREQVTLELPAALMLAEAADGSVRDGLSLLDQAIVMADGTVQASIISDMLGQTQNQDILTLFKHLIQGKMHDALDGLEQLYQNGADPAMIIQDLLRLTQQLTLRQIGVKAPVSQIWSFLSNLNDESLNQISADRLNIIWQMFLKGLSEVQTAFAPLQTAQMLFIRVGCYLALPSPGEISSLLVNQGKVPPSLTPQPFVGKEITAPTHSTKAFSAPLKSDVQQTTPEPQAFSRPKTGVSQEQKPDFVSKPSSSADQKPLQVSMPKSLEDLLLLLDEHRQVGLHAHLIQNVRLIRFAPGVIEYQPTSAAPTNLSLRLSQFLQETTGKSWEIIINNDQTQPGLTIAEQRQQQRQQQRDMAVKNTVVQQVLKHFPGSKIENIRTKEKDNNSLPVINDKIDMGTNPEETSE
ncbi:MAG TPA: DNA polymerase III subunit gamma/tau [Alphaproteobacteria bacterium]|nr:DNA polymerase III subunit gamma/tau [Alphaproteobacteria bacterium]